MQSSQGRRPANRMCPSGLRRMALLAAVICLFAAFAPALKKAKKGQETRSVEGTVSMPGDKPVPGAVVQLKNTKTLAIRSFITRDNGTYVFYELSPDIDYELTARANGATSDTKTLSSFDSRTDAVINLQLHPKK